MSGTDDTGKSWLHAYFDAGGEDLGTSGQPARRRTRCAPGPPEACGTPVQSGGLPLADNEDECTRRRRS